MSSDGPFARLLQLIPPDVFEVVRTCTGDDAHIIAASAIQRTLFQHPAFREEIRTLTDPTVEGCSCRAHVAEEEARLGRAAFAAGDMAAAAERFSAALIDTDGGTPGGAAAAARLHANRAACLLRMSGAGMVALATADATEVRRAAATCADCTLCTPPLRHTPLPPPPPPLLRRRIR